MQVILQDLIKNKPSIEQYKQDNVDSSNTDEQDSSLEIKDSEDISETVEEITLTNEDVEEINNTNDSAEEKSE